MDIPEELKEHQSWILWKTETRNGKKIKIPCNGYGMNISVTRPPFDYFERIYTLSQERRYGIGYVFTGNGIVGIDMDNVLEEDRETALYWVHRFGSYTEISPSGKGLHIIVKGQIPGSRRRNGRYEIYSTERFFTVTGNKLAYDTIKEVDLLPFYNEMIEKPKLIKEQYIPKQQITSSDLLKTLQGNPKFAQLYYGNTRGYSSQSEAEMAFCSILAHYTDDRQVIDNIMRSSYLYRNKWDERRGKETYGHQTISKVLP